MSDQIVDQYDQLYMEVGELILDVIRKHKEKPAPVAIAGIVAAMCSILDKIPEREQQAKLVTAVSLDLTTHVLHRYQIATKAKWFESLHPSATSHMH